MTSKYRRFSFEATSWHHSFMHGAGWVVFDGFCFTRSFVALGACSSEDFSLLAKDCMIPLGSAISPSTIIGYSRCGHGMGNRFSGARNVHTSHTVCIWLFFCCLLMFILVSNLCLEDDKLWTTVWLSWHSAYALISLRSFVLRTDPRDLICIRQ